MTDKDKDEARTVEAMHTGDWSGVEEADEVTRLRARVAELEAALEPFAEKFTKRRDSYSRRYQDQALGYKNFDKMPDHWPMDKLIFNMGQFRRARAALNKQEPSDG